jgi:hypothetical protein
MIVPQFCGGRLTDPPYVLARDLSSTPRASTTTVMWLVRF